MNLVIRIEDGLPVDHPILEENFIQAFPEFDVNNLPSSFAKFIRLEAPPIGIFQVYDGCTYEWDGDVVKDVHKIREMTAGERYAVIESIKAKRPNESWTWHEERLMWLAPKHPTTSGPWKWDVLSQDWVIATKPPFPSWVVSEDGTRYVAPTPIPEGAPYMWDEETLSWVVVDKEGPNE